MIQWAEKQQALRLCLDVTKSNEHAIALYFRHGFVDAGELTPANPGDAPERRFLRNLALSPDRSSSGRNCGEWCIRQLDQIS